MTKKPTAQRQAVAIPRVILLTAKFLETVSLKLVTLFAAKLFTTPLKHKIPKREMHMFKASTQTKLYVSKIKKEIIVYQYGSSARKVLLVHGWSGRGTQLVKIADKLLELGYSTVSFDAPAHGKSTGQSSIMTEFIDSILEVEKQYGNFEYAIGHSLGGMGILNAIRENLKVKKAIIIGSGDIIQDIIDDFIQKLQLQPRIGLLLKNHFEKKYKVPMEKYAASEAAKEVTIPVLIIHDNDDEDVAVKAAHNIHKNLRNSEIMITNHLGHRKILGDTAVIEKIKEFIIN